MTNPPETRPEIFGYADFCKAVTGYTDSELRQAVRDGVIDDIAKARNFDQPRTDTEKVMDNYFTFMSMEFKIPILKLPIDELYQYFDKFRKHEKYIHPRDRFGSWETYLGPTYATIDSAFEEKDEESFMTSLQELVDKILHR